MATLIARQSGNWTDANTWNTIATGTGASVLGAPNSNINISTTGVTSDTFTLTNGEVIDGVLVYLIRASTSLAGVTVTISLRKGGVNQRSVTVNATDLFGTGTNDGSAAWYFFKFSSTYTANGDADFAIHATASVTSRVSIFYSGASVTNWIRALRTTTTAAIGATDTSYILPEWTGAGAKTDITVTMDSTSSATSYGNIIIGRGGVLSYGTNASTNYALKVAGNITIERDAVFNIGTTATPIPRSSTATLQLASASANQYTLTVQTLGTFNAHGESRSSGNNSYFCLLTANGAINATSLSVDRNTGWLDNDVIVVSPTGTDRTQGERGALNGNATATTLTVDGFGGVGGGLQFAHNGTGVFAAEVINLTRNIKIFGGSSTNTMALTAQGTFECDWTEMYWLGTFSNATTTALNWNYCSIYESGSFTISDTDFVMTNNVFYLNSGGIATPSYTFGTQPAVGPTITGNVYIRTTSSSTSLSIFDIRCIRGTFNDNRIAGFLGHGLTLFGLNEPLSGIVIRCGGTSSGQRGIGVTNTYDGYGSITNCNVTTVGVGIDFTASPGVSESIGVERTHWFVKDCEITEVFYALGMTTVGTYFEIENCIFSGTTTRNMLDVFNMSAPDSPVIDMRNCTVRPTSGSYVAPANVFQISMQGVGTYAPRTDVQITADNCVFNSTGAIVDITNSGQYSTIGYFASQRHNQITGNHRTEKQGGVITSDTVIYKTSSPSERLTPNNSTTKLKSGMRAFAIANATTKTVKVWVRESVVGDGTDYNGNRARLVLRKLYSGGITSDQILDTATSSSEGAWEELSGVTPTVTTDCVLQVYIDCDGTTGWVNVDDWSIT